MINPYINKINLTNKAHIALAFIISFVIIFSIILLTKVIPFKVPDENTHFQLALATEANESPFGINIKEFRHFAGSDRYPYLFNTIMGTLLNFKPEVLQISDFVYLRLINLSVSIIGIIFIYLIANSLLGRKKLATIVTMLMAITPMYLFLLSGINYDNFINTLSYASIYFLIKLFRDKNTTHLLIVLNIITIAPLIKVSFLPLSGLIFLTILYIFFPYSKQKLKNIFKFRKFDYLLLVFFAVGLLLSINLFGINLIRYKSIVPKCNDIFTAEECSENPLVGRNEKILVEVTPNRKFEYRDPVAYGLFWVENYFYRFLGIYGQGFNVSNNSFSKLFYLIFVGSIFMLFTKFKNKLKKEHIALFFITFIFSLVLLLLNYFEYLKYGVEGLGLQGRYLFPVLPLIYIYIVFIVNRFIRYKNIALAILIIILLLNFYLVFNNFPVSILR